MQCNNNNKSKYVTFSNLGVSGCVTIVVCCSMQSVHAGWMCRNLASEAHCKQVEGDARPGQRVLSHLLFDRV